MEWLLNTIHYVVPFLFLLGVLVFVHEFGHFIIARKLGVAVSAFSIGFGKSLWSKTDKQGTEWKISAIPLGGYCQFLGDADESSSTTEVDLSKYTEEIAQEKDERCNNLFNCGMYLLKEQQIKENEDD